MIAHESLSQLSLESQIHLVNLDNFFNPTGEGQFSFEQGVNHRGLYSRCLSHNNYQNCLINCCGFNQFICF